MNSAQPTPEQVPGRPTGTTRPYRLRALLVRHRIPQIVLGEALRMPSGQGDEVPMSRSAISRVVVHQAWPTHVDRAACQARMVPLLRRFHVPEDEIKTAWESDVEITPQAAPSRGHQRSRPDANQNAAQDPFNLPEKTMLSPAVRAHFGLPADPFHNDITGPQDLFLARDQRYVRESMYYAAKHQGFLAIVGESGSGKSTLRRDLLARMQRENDRIVVIRPSGDSETGGLRAPHLCDAIVRTVSSERMKQSLEARSRQIERVLSASARTGYAHVLLIEEAQDLTKPTLKYLKRLWEKEDGFTRLLGVVLIGQTELGDMLNEQKNPDLREVIRRCEVAHLRPLDANLEDYLAFKLKRVGTAVPEVFEPDAVDALRNRLTRRNRFTGNAESMVYPLVVNNAVAAAMTCAADLGLKKISAELVGRL